MIKYEVYKERDIEMRTMTGNITHQDLYNYLNERTDSRGERIAAFNTKSEAHKFFLNEREFCNVRTEKRGSYYITLFDWLYTTMTGYEGDDVIMQIIEEEYIGNI